MPVSVLWHVILLLGNTAKERNKQLASKQQRENAFAVRSVPRCYKQGLLAKGELVGGLAS
jgi:hypothetical protein